MKTIEEAAVDYAESLEGNDYTIETEAAFKAGAEFAQRWISVDEVLPEVSKQVIVKLPNDWHTCTWLMKDGTFAFNVKPTHWRPIELK